MLSDTHTKKYLLYIPNKELYATSYHSESIQGTILQEQFVTAEQILSKQ